MKMLIVVALFVLVPAPVNAMTLQEMSYGGGDCHAQLADGDTYISEIDESCVTSIIGDTAVNDMVTLQGVDFGAGGTVRVTSTQTDNNQSHSDNPAVVADNQSGNDKPDKQHCDKGSGNGGEGCDPGNNPSKGNDDEGNK